MTKLEQFENYMASNSNGWLLLSKTDNLLAYQKVIPGRGRSLLLTLLLLFLGIIPGLLYLVFARGRPTEVLNFTASLGPDQEVVVKGNSTGTYHLKRFQKQLLSRTMRS